MNNVVMIDETCGPADRILRHERELGNLTTITKAIEENNRNIASSLDGINNTISDIRIIKENIKDLTVVKDHIITFQQTIYDLSNNIKDMKDETADNTSSIKSLENSTSHLGWLNKGIKTATDNFGVMVIVGILALFFLNWTGILKTIELFK